MRQQLKHVDRFSIIKLDDGTVGVWERKAKTLITSWNKCGMLMKMKLDIEVEVLKNPCHLAADYLDKYNEREDLFISSL